MTTVCLKSWLHLRQTSYLLWPNHITFPSLLLSHSSTSLYLALPQFVNCRYYCYLSLYLALPQFVNCRYYCYLSFAPNLITAILSTINSLSLNYPISNRRLFVLSLKHPSLVISLPSYALSTGSESLKALNISSSHLPTTFSQLPNRHTFITSSLFNVLKVLALHLSLLLLGHRNHPL